MQMSANGATPALAPAASAGASVTLTMGRSTDVGVIGEVHPPVGEHL
jgi:hypothetical protein